MKNMIKSNGSIFYFLISIIVITPVYAWKYKVRNELGIGCYVQVNATGSKKSAFVKSGETVDFEKFGAMIGDFGGLCFTDIHIKGQEADRWRFVNWSKFVPAIATGMGAASGAVVAGTVASVTMGSAAGIIPLAIAGVVLGSIALSEVCKNRTIVLKIKSGAPVFDLENY